MALQPDYVEHPPAATGCATTLRRSPTRTPTTRTSRDRPASTSPRVIAGFIPRGGTLRHRRGADAARCCASAARERAHRLVAVGDRRRRAARPQDLLALFPYHEHPRNIALVARSREQLGVDRELAHREMADHVVPDLGVLKIYPPARVRGRVLRVHQRHERQRAHRLPQQLDAHRLDDHDVAASPAEWIVTVVNNRADRVAAREVFARILVEDVAVDAHVLIGTNLRGLKRYIDDALRRYCAAIEVIVKEDVRSSGAAERAAHRLATLLARLRIPRPTPARITERIAHYAAAAGLGVADHAALNALLKPLCAPAADAALDLATVRREVTTLLEPLARMLVATQALPTNLPEVLAEPDLTDVLQHAIRQASRIALHARLATRVAAVFPAGTSYEACNELVRRAYHELFEDLLVVVDDAGETGDQIIDRCARAVPPGTQVSVMGIQNIKGTGLDFVYRWLALDQTQARLSRLDSDDRETRLAALRELDGFEDYGMVDAALASATLSVCEPLARRGRSDADQERV